MANICSEDFGGFVFFFVRVEGRMGRPIALVEGVGREDSGGFRGAGGRAAGRTEAWRSGGESGERRVDLECRVCLRFGGCVLIEVGEG